MKITVIADNNSREPFLSEHGLSLYIEYKGKHILFDCGAGGVITANLHSAGITPSAITDIILSHGHYDHTGGLAEIMASAGNSRIWCSPQINTIHYSCHKNKAARNISIPAASAASLAARPHIEYIDTCREIMPGIWLSGQIPRISGEDTGGPFYCGPADTFPADTIPDEIALLLDNGTLIQGCCHAGIINTVTHFRNVCPHIKIKRFVGGLHLQHADRKRLQSAGAFLEKMALEEVVLLHCTGEVAVEYLKGFLSCRVTAGYAGMVIPCTQN